MLPFIYLFIWFLFYYLYGSYSIVRDKTILICLSKTATAKFCYKYVRFIAVAMKVPHFLFALFNA